MRSIYGLRIWRIKLKLKRVIKALADNPRPFGYLKLKGRSGYRIRVSRHRIIYDIYDNILTVEVLELGDRKDIYG